MTLTQEELKQASDAVNEFFKNYGFEKWKSETHFLMSNRLRDEEIDREISAAA